MRRFKHVLYCNLEDTRLFGMTQEDFPNFLAAVDQVSASDATVFLDEVQEVEGWERLVRALLDRRRNVCATGSSASFRQRLVAPRKYYAIDNGLRRVNAPGTTPDCGRRLENFVFLELRSRGETLHYAGEKDVWECDFVTERNPP